MIWKIEGTLTLPTYIEYIAVVRAQHAWLEPLFQVRLVVETGDDDAAEGWYKVKLELVYATVSYLLDDILTVFQAQRHRLHFEMRACV